MKRFLLLTIALSIAASLASTSWAATLTLIVDNLRDYEGRVAVAIYNTEDGFPSNHTQSLQRFFISLNAGQPVESTIKNLPSGKYALAIFHDDDLSGKLETNLFGIPRKGYGFSNNVNPSMRAAYFNEAAFDLPDTGATQRIKMIYR